jgi:hypothetical protein
MGLNRRPTGSGTCTKVAAERPAAVLVVLKPVTGGQRDQALALLSTARSERSA